MRVAVYIIALLIVGYHLLYVVYPIQSSVLHLTTHLMCCLSLYFLVNLQKTQKKIWKICWLAFVMLSLFATIYIRIMYPVLATRLFFNTIPDLIVGIILIIVTLIAAQRAFGWIIPAIVIASVIYPFLGVLMPEPFHCTSYKLDQVISNLALASNIGIFGTPLYTSAYYLFLFLVFGGLLESSGATEFFLQLGRLVGRRFRSGPAMTSVISSACIGSINGSVMANIAITGSFTIPWMKRMGYTPEQAGGIELAASNGGQILPPVMGVAAFLMAGITGIPYVKICAMALIPALLYYFNVAIYVQLQAHKIRISENAKGILDVDTRKLLVLAPRVIIPFGIIVALLVMGYSVMLTAFSAIIVLFLLTLFSMRKFSLSQFNNLASGFVRGAIIGAEIGIITAAIGIFLASFDMIGFGLKLSMGLETLSGGYLWVGLFVVWILATLLGVTGLGPAAYIIVSLFGVSALMKLGIQFEVAHFFILFPCMFGGVAPPVALFAMFAAKLAQADYMKTAIEGFKMAGLGLLFGFIFVPHPELLMLSGSQLGAMALVIVLFVIVIVACQGAFANYLWRPLHLSERVALGLVAGTGYGYLLSHSMLLLGIFSSFLIVSALLLLLTKRTEQQL